MTAPDDLIRRDTAERAIREMGCIHDYYRECCSSVALAAIRALPADPVAEAAGKRIAELEAAVSDAMVVIADMAPGETVLIDRLRSLLAKGGA